MNQRKILWCCSLALALFFAGACQSASISTGPPVQSSGWASVPKFDAALRGRRFHVNCEDPSKSSLGAQLTREFVEALTAKGYQSVDSTSDADLLCVLVVRYFGHTLPPDGHTDLLTQAADTIQGGDEGWLAADGSGFDTKSRKPKVMKYKTHTHAKILQWFTGHEDDEWTLLVDVAIGARTDNSGKVVQRHEGRVWASIVSVSLDRAPAIQGLIAEIRKRLPEGLP